MPYQFLVSHSPDSLPKQGVPGMPCLTEDEIQAEYSRLCAYCTNFFAKRPRLGAHCSFQQPVTAGLRVSFDTDLDALSVRNILESFLAEVNTAKPGLRLTAVAA